MSSSGRRLLNPGLDMKEMVVVVFVVVVFVVVEVVFVGGYRRCRLQSRSCSIRLSLFVKTRRGAIRASAVLADVTQYESQSKMNETFFRSFYWLPILRRFGRYS